MSKNEPTIYISNWSSSRTPGHHGISGRKLSIMVKTPDYVVPDGRVEALVPDEKDLWATKQGSITSDIYKNRYLKSLWEKKSGLEPGMLRFRAINSEAEQIVQHGDTLCCVCSRKDAADDRCHRAWAATVLKEAGWVVILDGKKVKCETSPTQVSLFDNHTTP